jgi:glycosyltransferase involved in cell wall biosynthesis
MEKGFEVALRAFAKVEDPEAQLVIVGEGGRREALTALARELGVADRVSFPGYARDIRPWLETARAFLLSSYYEGYAAVIVEALGAGRPVVSTDCTPAAGELLGSRLAGQVAPIGDVEALAACLNDELARPAPDPAALAALVDDYRIGPIADAYLRVFDAVAAKRAARMRVRFVAPAFAIPFARPAPGRLATARTAWRRSA